ncbi:MAG: nitroreductase [Desulfovibrionaceae bacterium CG1_02_65_16]|nr:MAG: nitroreductase [Desulfovibrionaceae bacterium CG1_02_65_16]
MDRRKFICAAGTLAVGLAGMGAASLAGAATPGEGAPGLAGKTLVAALRVRKSERAYADAPLDEAQLLELLWAAFGVNRSDGRRTAPSALNRQEIAIYAARKDGLFLYDAHNGALTRKLKADLRAKTGVQGYVGTAPVNLIYVADMDRVAGGTPEARLVTAGLDTGFISQNVYLYCAAAGLATVARTGIEIPALSKAMGLAANQRVILAQCVGHPKA